MTLRTRARLVALVSALVFLALLGVFLAAYQERTRTARDLALTESLTLQTAQFRTDLFGYLLDPQRLERAQVETQFAALADLLVRQAPAIAEAVRGDEQNRSAWENIRRLVGDMRARFAELGGGVTDPRLAERDRRTTDLIRVNSHSLVLYGRQLRSHAVAGFLAAAARESQTLGALLAGMVGLGLGLFVVIGRTILRPVRQLQAAAVRVAAGETGLRMASAREDEFGQLADAFDRMLDQIQETTVSRDRLEAEVIERRRAEAEVSRLNADLEERVRQRTAELHAANAELESFAYAVSHDLRAPLRALSGFSQALMEDYGDRLDGEAQVYLRQIDQASRRMGALIDGILTLSRSTRGERRLDPVDLSRLARRLLTEHAQAEPERQVDWMVEPEMRTQGDPTMLEVVMRNLIDNAWKYTSKTTAATIEIGAEDGPAEQPGQRWFYVADNGAGFDMAYTERLFKPFQRLHRQDEFPGMGIGLATVQRIVHRHGGVIEARGTAGGGARFRMTLPVPDGRGTP